ncbi:unnamed protein product [Symbiodinium natans]|uniref:Uncharacterized protein n=1 Tax=Symbiodinium natans TaxID=878477 RepID=A0A812UKP2_9DINO|nr:unnamed protein product [Symbiodinium natans]
MQPCKFIHLSKRIQFERRESSAWSQRAANRCFRANRPLVFPPNSLRSQSKQARCLSDRRGHRKGLRRVKTWVTEEDARPRLPSLEEEVEQESFESNLEVEQGRFDSNGSWRKLEMLEQKDSMRKWRTQGSTASAPGGMWANQAVVKARPDAD